MKTVVVLAGGYSTEHQISLASGRTAEAAFIEAGYKVLFVVLKKDGFWLKDQLIKLTDDPKQRLVIAWERCFAKPIDSQTLESLSEFVEQQAKVFAEEDEKREAGENETLALASACQAMMSSNAFLYID